MGPRKDQRVGYHVFAPVVLGASQNHSFSDVLWHLHCACSVPRCGLHINVCRLEGVQPECSHVGKFPCFFSFSVVLINPQQSAESAIYPPHRVLRLGACAKTKPHGSSIQPRFLGSRKAATLKPPPTMSTQFMSATSLTSPSKDRAIPFRFAVVLLECTDAGVLVHYPCLGVRLNFDFTSSLLPPKVSPFDVLRIPMSVFTPPGLDVFRWNRRTVLRRLMISSVCDSDS